MSSRPPRLVGVINLTSDSKCEVYESESEILRRARELRRLGVEIVDLGAKSSTLAGADFSTEEEAARLLRALELLKSQGLRVSIDSWNAGVAERCAAAGADILNDTSGPGANEIIDVAGRHGTAIVLNWVSGANPRLRRQVSSGEDLVGPMIPYFEEKISRALEAGVEEIILDPGMGFLKTRDDDEKTKVQITVMRQLDRLRVLERPLLTIAPIRHPDQPMTPSTIMLYYFSLASGADYIRVHYPEILREIQELVEGWQRPAPDGGPVRSF